MVSQVQTRRIPMRRLALFTFLIWVRATATGDYHAWHLDFVPPLVEPWIAKCTSEGVAQCEGFN